MKQLKSLSLVLSILLTLTSCEESDNGQVKITVNPSVPVVALFDYVDGEDSVTAPWFAYTLSFENATDKDLFIQTIEISYRFDDVIEFTDPESLSPKGDNDAYIVAVGSGVSAAEYQLIGKLVGFNRYVEDLPDEKEEGRKFEDALDYNYYVKLEAKGYFTERDRQDNPLSAFNKVIYFRTKGPEL